MVTFNIRETGNELLRILEKEFGLTRDCSLTIDMLIPEMVSGDKDGLCATILLICQHLNQNLLNTSVNIELSKVPHSGESLYIKIDVKGLAHKREITQQFLRVYRTDVDALLARLAYRTTFSTNGMYVRFSFTMQFFGEHDSQTDRSQLLNKKILLVEDDDMTALVFISFMEEWEYVVTRVSDGASAVDAAKVEMYDIILMDTYMPKMSGAEAIRTIRALDKKIPIITLTTSPVEEDFADRYAGANDFLIKPVSAAALQCMLKRYL